MNKSKLLIIFLIFAFGQLYANERFEEENIPFERALYKGYDGSRDINSPGSPSGISSTVTDTTTPASNDYVNNGSESVDEVSGALTLRYTDINFPSKGKVDFDLNRVFTMSMTDVPEGYKIDTYWMFDMPFMTNEGVFSPSAGVTIDIKQALTAKVIGNLERAVKVDNAIIVENGITSNLEGTRSIYIPKTKSLLKINTLKFNSSRNITEIENVEYITPNGMVFVLKKYHDHLLVSRITDINRQNSMRFSYKEVKKETNSSYTDPNNHGTYSWSLDPYDEDPDDIPFWTHGKNGPSINEKPDDSIIYAVIDKIEDVNRNQYNFEYEETPTYKTYDYVDYHRKCNLPYSESIVGYCQVKKWAKVKKVKIKRIETYSDTIVEYVHGTAPTLISHKVNDTHEFHMYDKYSKTGFSDVTLTDYETIYIDYDSLRRVSKGKNGNFETINYIEDITAEVDELKGINLSIEYPKGGSSNYIIDEKGRVTSSILKEDKSFTDTNNGNRKITYSYHDEENIDSHYLELNTKYGRTEINSGYYKNNVLTSPSRKVLYYQYEGSGDDKKLKYVNLVISDSSIKRYKEENYKEICTDYWVPQLQESFTKKGWLKNSKTITYDSFGNPSKIDSLVKKVKDENTNTSNLTTTYKYNYSQVNSSNIWNNPIDGGDGSNEISETNISEYPSDLVYSDPISLFSNSLKKTALNSITLKGGFSNAGFGIDVSKEVRLRIHPGIPPYAGSESTPTPSSFSLPVEIKITNNQESDKSKKYRKEIFTYDNRLNKTSETKVLLGSSGNEERITTKYGYYTNNKLEYIEDNFGRIKSYTYEEVEDFSSTPRQNSTITDVLFPLQEGTHINVTMPIGYTVGEKVIETINYSGLSVQNYTVFDLKGKIVETGYENPRYRETRFEYDYLDRLENTYIGSLHKSKTIYTGNITETYDAEGNCLKIVKDGLGRVISEQQYIVSKPNTINLNGVLTLTDAKLVSNISKEYHPLFIGNVTKHTIHKSGSNYVKENTYDELGREETRKVNNITVSKTIYHDEANAVITLDYITADSAPNRKLNYGKVVKDWNGNITDLYRSKETIEDNILNNSIPKIHTKYTFDGFSNKLSMSLAYGEYNLQQDFTYEYDNLGVLKKLYYPDGTFEEYQYYTDIDESRFYGRSGNETITLNNILGLPDSVRNADGVITYLYNELGAIDSVIGWANPDTKLYEYSYIYDGYGRLSHELKSISVGSSTKDYTIERSFDKIDSVNRLIFTTSGFEKNIKYKLPYDTNDITPENKVLILQNPNTNIATFNYTEWGAIDNIISGYGTHQIITDYSNYDNFLRPKKIGAKNKTYNYLDLEYSYDNLGNITQYINNGVINNYDYDGLSRLIKENDKIYNYDSLNNRDNISLADTSSPEIDYIYNISSNLMVLDKVSNTNGNDITYQYDLNGNVTSKTVLSNTTYYKYNSNNQLIKVIDTYNNVIGEYSYDFNGQRIYKSENGLETYYVYDGNNILFEEGKKKILNVIYNGLNVGKFVDNNLEFHILDHLGSRRIAFDIEQNPDTNIISSSSFKWSNYTAFGIGESEEYSFTGKQKDNTTGLVYFNARYYDPEIGRFTTEDPIRDGLNWYVYCENNPMKYIDPTGLFTNAPRFIKFAYQYFNDHITKTVYNGVNLTITNPYWVLNQFNGEKGAEYRAMSTQIKEDRNHHSSYYQSPTDFLKVAGYSENLSFSFGYYTDNPNRSLGLYFSMDHGYGIPDAAVSLHHGTSTLSHDSLFSGASSNIAYGLSIANLDLGGSLLRNQDSFVGSEFSIGISAISWKPDFGVYNSYSWMPLSLNY